MYGSLLRDLHNHNRHLIHKTLDFDKNVVHHIAELNQYILKGGRDVLTNPHTLPVLENINRVTTAVIVSLPTDVVAPGLKEALSAGNMALGSAMQSIQMHGSDDKASAQDLQEADIHYKDAIEHLPPDTDPKVREALETSQKTIENLLKQKPLPLPSPAPVPPAHEKKGFNMYWLILVAVLLVLLISGGVYLAMNKK